MDALPIALVVALLVALVLVGRLAGVRGRELDAVRAVLGAPGGDSTDLPRRARDLARRAAAAEADLERQARAAPALADLLAVGFLRLDDDLRIESANERAHALLGRPPGSLAGRTALETFVDARAEDLVRSARDGGLLSGEFRFRGADGPVLRLRAGRGPGGGTWVAIEELTELRRLQQIRAEFIDNLSHELRTPLTTVSLLAETLTREADAAGDAVPARMRERIGKIEVETGHLVQMVNELLDLARIESGGALLLRDTLDLGRVATESAERLRLFAERQGIGLEVDAAPGGVLPSVRGDEARLGQVLVNLVHNAVKFSDAGTRVTVRARATDDRREVVVSVEDQGIGVPKADQARIFERFYKVDRARVRGAGTGLGLSIARNVVELHGGRLWVESQEGVGSTFSFALPVAAAGEPSD